MAKSIEDRVKDSFDEDSREDIFKYLDWVRSTILDCNQAMRRMITFVILLIAVFEFVAHSRTTRITIASFQLTRGSIVLILLPGLVAFLFVQIMADVDKVERLTDIYTEVFRLWSEKAEYNDLEIEVLNDPPLYWAMTGNMLREENQTKVSKLASSSGIFFSIVVIIGIVGFEADAYYVLFPGRSLGLILWLISLCFTLICLILAYFMLFWE